jgi:NAD(P)-dependent dehydrogenase (short-subunit alcohol dehydrogenase family)
MAAPLPYYDPLDLPDYSRMVRLDGRRFVVMGSGGGLGRHVAHAVRANGARVVCIDLYPDRADRVAAEVSGLGIGADASVRSEFEEALSRAEDELGGIDGLVDVIGANPQRMLLEATDEDWQAAFDVCLRPAALAVQIGGAAIARAGGGTMAFVSSSLAFGSVPGSGPYSAAKAALVSLVRSAAVELGPLGIRVNAVAPTTMASYRALYEGAGVEARRARMIAAAKATATGRVNSTRDVASVLLFLSCELSGNISGETISITGGRSQA